MGARPSQFKKSGGGRLNNVDGKITGYEFTTVFPFGDGGKSKSDFTSLYFVLSVLPDGADDAIKEPIWAGNADPFKISKDGLTLTPVENGFELSENSDFARFMASLCQADSGFPEERLSETVINYEPIIGTRARFIQVPQMGKDGKPRTRTASKGKYKGKTFPSTATQVLTVLELPQTASKANGEVATGKKGDTGLTLPQVTSQAVLDILGETEDGTLEKAKLRLRMKQKLGTYSMVADAIKLALDETFLAGLDGVDYDPDAKGQVIALA